MGGAMIIKAVLLVNYVKVFTWSPSKCPFILAPYWLRGLLTLLDRISNEVRVYIPEDSGRFVRTMCRLMLVKSEMHHWNNHNHIDLKFIVY